MRLTPLLLRLSLLGGSVFLATCAEPSHPPTTGTIAPRITILKDPQRPNVTFGAVRGRIVGNSVDRTVDLTLSGGFWVGTISDVAAGTYRVTIEGLNNGEVDYFGENGSVTVVAGQTVEPTLTMQSVVSVMASITPSVTTAFSLRANFSKISIASSYSLQWSTSSTFASGTQTITVPDTTGIVAVGDVGTYFVRARPTVANTSTGAKWSDAVQVQVVDDGTARTPDAATIMAFSNGVPDTIVNRNVTPANPQSWFSMPARAGDSLFAETFASRLTVPSTLNSVLTLYRADGTTVLASNDNQLALSPVSGDNSGSLASEATTDARIVAVAPETETYLLKVSGAGNTVGNYTLVTEQRRLPAPPSTLNASTFSDTRIDLAWADNADNEATYRIERCGGSGCTDFAEIDSVAADVVAYADNTVAVGNAYRYRVRARNLIGNSAYTSVADGSTEMPSAPTTLNATTFSGTRVDLAWTDNASNELGFKVERCSGASCSTFTQIATLTANTTSYSDVGAVVDQRYTYRVRAFNAAGASSYSNNASANTLRPAAPSGLTATTTSPTQIDLSWTDNSGNETSFRVERCTGVGCESDEANFAEVGNVGAGITVYSSTVATGETYAFRVRARNVSGNSAYSAIAIGATTVPADPSGLTASTTSGTSIHLAWTDNANNETTFRIERCAGAGCEGDVSNFAEVASVAADVTSYDDNGLTLNTTYSYRVRARNAVDNSAGYSNTATSNTNVPTVPTTLTATPSGVVANQIDLTWVDASSDETGFRIERCVGVGCTDFAEIATVGPDVQAYSNSGLTPNVTYRYQVRAYNASGPSDPSNIATASTNLPAPPTSLFAVVGSSTQIDLTWIDQAANEDNFELQRCAGVGCEGDASNFSLAASLPANTTAYSDQGLTAGQTYAYRVRATNSVGNSGFSNLGITSLVVPGDPAGLAATTISASKISLSWTDNASNEAGFHIERCAGVSCSSFAEVGTVSRNTAAHIDSSGVSLGESYSYRVVAYNAIGVSGYSNTATSTTILPATPDGLDAVTLSNTQINLTWTDHATNETGYEVERCTGATCTDFAQIAVLAADVASYQNTGLTPDVEYRYRVRAVNAAGTSAYSNIDNAATNFPADPTALTVVAAGSTQINLSWTDNATSEDGYIVERCLGLSCSDFAQIQLVGADVAAYADGTVAADTWYTYRVQAYNSNGGSQYSNEAATNTSAASAPAGLTAQTLSGTDIYLSWTDNSDNELGFEVQRCLGVGCEADDNNFATLTTVAANLSEYHDVTVSVNGTYGYRVRAANNVTSSAFTTPATANTILPADPTGANATTISATQIQVTWNDVASNEDGYRIERCVGDACSDFAELVTVGAGTTAHQDNTVALGNSYTYRVVAYNVSGASNYTPDVTATTILPGAPAGLSATPSSPTTVDVTWTDNSSNELGFRIERCSGISCSSFAEITTVATGTTTYPNSGLSGNTFYSYRVRAYNAAGTSPYAGPANTNTFIPAAPTGLTATTIVANQIDLGWTDAANNETGFRIERCSGAACSDFTEIATAGSNVTAYQDLGVTLGNQYTYRVRAYNAVGSSTFSGAVSATTQNIPVAPSALNAGANGQTTIDLSWTDNSSNETGFRIERCTGVSCSNFAEIGTVGANIGNYADNTVAADESYSYRVRAYFDGSSGYSNSATATTILPGAPSALAAVAVSNTVVDLTWVDNANNETGFRIERCAGGSCSDFAELTIAAADATGYSDNTAAAGASYTYRVRAYNGAGASAYTNESSVGTTVPAIPSGLTATTAHASQIDLQWTDNSADEDGFYIERCQGAGCTDFTQIRDSVSATPSDAGVATWFDQTVTAGFRYRYRVRAYKTAGGSSGYTNIAAAGTDVPAAATGFTVANTGPTSIHLAWTDNADNELSYRVERCDGAGCGGDVSNFFEVASLPANTSSYDDTGIAAGESFTYRVRGVNAAGGAAYTGLLTETTLLPADPTNLLAQTQSATAIHVTWDDNANNEVTYKLERCTGDLCADFALIATLDSNTTEYMDSPVPTGTSFTYRIYAERPAGVSGFSNESSATTSFPSDPSTLSAVTASATQIDLTWADNASNETAFQVERCAGDGCSSFAFLASLGSDAVGFSDNTVTLGNSYSYRVRAMGVAGNSGFSNTATATTYLPNSPASLTTATTAAAPTIKLNWSDASSDEGGFSIERCAGAGCEANAANFAEVTTVGANVTSFDDSGIALDEYYSYRVRAFNAAGASVGYTNVSISNTLPPAAPTALSAATATGTQINLAWTDNADNEVGFQIERCAGAGCSTFAVVGSVGPDVNAYLNTGLDFNESYTYRVRAINVIANSAYTSDATATTIPPAPATTLNATVISGAQIDLAWTDNSDNENSFVIERCSGAGCSSFAVIDSVGPDNAAFSDFTVTTNQSYSYRVRANNYAYTADPTNESTVNTFLPASPAGLTATAVSGQQVDLTWIDNANNETGYYVERCSGGGCSFTPIATLGADAQNYSDNSAPFGVNHAYRVRAYNVAGPSGFAGPQPASTILLPPTGERAFTIAANTIRVRWNDNSSIETGYQIQRCLGAGCNTFATVATAPPNDTSYTDGGLVLNDSYTYRVRAITTGGVSAFAGQAGARTATPVGNGTSFSGIADSTGGERFYVISVPAVSPTLVVTMNGPAGANLYVRRGAVPTVVGAPQNADTLCVPFSGALTEICNFAAPPATEYFIMLQGASAYAGASLAVSIGANTFSFNTCGASGPFGPDQTMCDGTYAGTSLEGRVGVSNGIQGFYFPYPGTWRVTSVGAAGASGDGVYPGGRGAYLQSTASLPTANVYAQILVGQAGTAQGHSGGGGGATYFISNYQWLVAGGGGGTRVAAAQGGCDAQLGAYGGTGSASSSTWACGAKVYTGTGLQGDLYHGGIVSSSSWGSGGGGYYDAGLNDGTWGTGGAGWLSGNMTGGLSPGACYPAGFGGFGGGGSGDGCRGGGGGGGISGGDGGWIAGGGGSYFSGGTNYVSSFGAYNAHGYVIIEWLGP